jgi:hypothetical protein
MMQFNEVDEQGRRRFRLFTDIDGVLWINALNRAERVSSLSESQTRAN